MKLLTTRCSEVAHPEIAIQIDERIVIESDAQAFLHGLEEEVLGGRRFEEGHSLQVGWAFTVFRKSESHGLAVWEPDMQCLPMKFVDSVTHTLMGLRVQRDVAWSLALSPAFPGMRESAVCCGALGEASVLALERFAPEGPSSGWFLHCGDPRHDHDDVSNLGRESLYAIAVSRPEVIPYLALPPGISLVLRDALPTELCIDGVTVKPKPGSYLDAALGRH